MGSLNALSTAFQRDAQAPKKSADTASDETSDATSDENETKDVEEESTES